MATDWKNIPTIKLDEIKPGDILGLDGTSSFAKAIKVFQKLKFGADAPYFINHNGFYERDVDGNLLVYEENDPGRFDCVPFDIDYQNSHADVYVGIPNKDISKGLSQLRQIAETMAGTTKLLDYSYKSIIGFAVNAVWYKVFKKNIWITGQPNGCTCSQAVIKLYQQCFGLFMSKAWWLWYPADTFMSEEITVYKIVY